jgi:uroporphyrinogen-III synthase
MERLKGISVVVTRPASLGHTLSQALSAEGAQVLLMPTLSIQAVPCILETQGVPSDVIFTSQFAAHHAPPFEWESTRISAIGPATARQLKAQQVPVFWTEPKGGDSHSLLTREHFQAVDGRAIWIVTGRRGRGVLGEKLQARGAQVTILPVYDRVCPDALTMAQRTEYQNAHIVVITSAEAFRNLTHLLGPESLSALQTQIVCVPSARIAQWVQACGFVGGVECASGPDDGAMLEAVCRAKEQLKSGQSE